MEIWKDIKGYEGLYQVSNHGRVKSFNAVKIKILKNSLGSNGYYRVSLWLNRKFKSYSVHVLVAEAFLGHISCGHKIVVDHVDNDPLNNNVSNLQLITSGDNTSKGYKRKGASSKYKGVYSDKRCKTFFSVAFVNGERKYLGTFETEIDAHNAFQKSIVSK